MDSPFNKGWRVTVSFGASKGAKVIELGYELPRIPVPFECIEYENNLYSIYSLVWSIKNKEIKIYVR